MLYPMFAIRDAKTGFMAPTVDQNDQVAIRNFLFGVRNSHDVLGACSEDFSLYRIGMYDSDSGVITPTVPSVWLCDGISAFTGKENE